MQLSLTVVIIVLVVFVTGLVLITIFSEQMGSYAGTQEQMTMSAFATDCMVKCSKVKQGDCPPDDWGDRIPGQDVSCYELIGNCDCEGVSFEVVTLE
jgi:hypothetical protein